MKDFLKFTLATVTGIVLTSLILFFIGIISVISIVSSTETETIVKKNSIMMLDLNGTLTERTQDDLNSILAQFNGGSTGVYGLDDILSSIQKAKDNDDIKGIYIKAQTLGTSYASLQSIRAALADFKESGKFVVAYADMYTQSLYYRSSIADKVLLNPQGMVDFQGLASTPMFYKEMLQKVGIEMQVFKVGTYKSAVEPFTSTEMSPANREQVSEFLGSIWNQLLTSISESRNISVDSLNAIANEMLM